MKIRLVRYEPNKSGPCAPVAKAVNVWSQAYVIASTPPRTDSFGPRLRNPAQRAGNHLPGKDSQGSAPALHVAAQAFALGRTECKRLNSWEATSCVFCLQATLCVTGSRRGFCSPGRRRRFFTFAAFSS